MICTPKVSKLWGALHSWLGFKIYIEIINKTDRISGLF